MTRAFEARLLDGVQARPHGGTVRIDEINLIFDAEDGRRILWPIESVVSSDRVGSDLHVLIAAGKDRGPHAHQLQLIVPDHSFEEPLDVARLQYSRHGGPGFVERARRMSLRAWLVIAILVLPMCWRAYTVLLPRAHVFISLEAEARLGDAIYQTLLPTMEAVKDPELDALIESMLTELADAEAGFNLRVSVVRDASANAFAVPGGQLIVNTGFLEACEDADTLAGVLAHEIAHVEQRHGLKHLLRSLGLVYFASAFIGGGAEGFESVETLGELSSTLLLLKHSRDHEAEADRLAIDMLTRAGRSPSGLNRFFEGIQDETTSDIHDRLTWVSTHPTTKERIRKAREMIGAGTDDSEAWMSPAEWIAIRNRVTNKK
ncbi:MAG: Zn-dependent protease with chaperone function [Planctomycetota bacterium]|jgi:Zn-dependent protease with chaperone function